MKILLSILGLCLLASCSEWKSWKPQGVGHVEKPFLIQSLNVDSSYLPGRLPVGLDQVSTDGEYFYYGTDKGELMRIKPPYGKAETLLTYNSPIVAAPIFDAKTMYVSTQAGDLYAYTRGKKTDLLFHQTFASSIEVAPVLDDMRLVVGLRNHSIALLDKSTGVILWTYKRAVTAIRTLQRRSSPIVVGQKVITGFADGYLTAHQIEDGKLLWESKITEFESKHFSDVSIQPMVFSKRLMTNAYQGYLKVVSLENGKLLRTLLEKPLSNYVVKSNILYFINMDGEFIELNENFEIKNRTPVAAKGLATQLVSWGDSFLLVEHSGRIQLLSKNGKREKVFNLGHHYSTVFGQMSTQDTYLALMSSRNRLYLFQNL
jgi:outer membrane protein assembly factor BamB